MARTRNPFRNIRLVFQRSRTSTKIVVIVAVVLSVLTLVALQFGIAAAKADTEQLRQEATDLERDKSRLELYIEQLGTLEGIIRIAQEELGLIEPGSIIIQPE